MKTAASRARAHGVWSAPSGAGGLESTAATVGVAVGADARVGDSVAGGEGEDGADVGAATDGAVGVGRTDVGDGADVGVATGDAVGSDGVAGGALQPKTLVTVNSTTKMRLAFTRTPLTLGCR